MAETETDFRYYAGQAIFPRSLADLTDTDQCPACLTSLPGAICQVCCLDLTHPVAAELAALSKDAATALDRRLDLIGRIRFATAQVLTAQQDRENAAATLAVTTVSAPFDALLSSPPARIVSPIVPQPVAPPTGAPPFSAPPSAMAPQPGWPEGPAAPRRSSVQIILLVVGISLLSVAAIFFLVYAFINFGTLARSLIIAAITVAAFTVASLLRRRKLTATAEGIAVFSVVLVYLDAFAIRANDFFGLASSDGAIFWGSTLVMTAMLFFIWNGLSNLRTASIVSFAAFAPGVGLIVGGLNDQVDGGTRAFFALAAVSLAGVVHRFAARPARGGGPASRAVAERILVLVTTTVAIVAAAVTAFVVAPGTPWASAFACLAIATIALLHVWLLDGIGDSLSRPFAAFFAGCAGVAAALAVASAAVRVGEVNLGVIAPPIAAVVVALGFEFASRRIPRASLAGLAGVAARSAAVVAAVALLFPAILATAATGTAASRGIVSSWSLLPSDKLLARDDVHGFAVLALAAVGAITVLAWTVGGTLRARGPLLAWFGAIVVVVAAPLLPTVASVLVAWLALAVLAQAAVIAVRRRGGVALRYRSPLVGLLAASGLLAYLEGWASTGTWWIASIVVIALLLTARRTLSWPLGHAVLLGAATVVLLIGAAATARQLALPGHPASLVDTVDAVRAVGIVAIALLALSAFPVVRLVSTRLDSTRLDSTLDRRTVFWIAGAAAGGSAVFTQQMLTGLRAQERMTLLLPEYGTSLAASAALLAALLLWLGRSKNAALRPERIAASIATAPSVFLLVDSFVSVLNLPEFARAVAPISATLLASVGALTVTLLRPTSSRWTRELGIVLVGVPSVFASVTHNDGATWLVLLLAGITVLILAISNDGLFSSVSPRRQLGWLALALATAGFWWRLFGDHIQNLEPYVLPLAGTFLLIALLLWRSAARSAVATPSRAAPLIVLGGLLVAILPLGLNAATGPLLRALLVGGISAVLLLVGSYVIGTPRLRPYLDVAALAGGIGVVVVTIERSIAVTLERGDPDLRLDAWLVACVVLLLAAAFGQARDRNDASVALRRIASQALGLVAMTALLLLETLAFTADRVGPIRALAVVLLFAAVHVIAFSTDRAPFTRLVAWVSIAYAGVAVVAGVLTGALGRVELGAIPIAIAVIATGALQLVNTPTARTWAWLAPGVLVLLVPSLLATAWDAPLWRLGGLGVVSIAIIVISVILRLQAPFLISVIVALIHGIATLLPQIRAVYVSVEWWLWVAIGGVIIVVIGARFEKSMNSFHSVAMRLKALR